MFGGPGHPVAATIKDGDSVGDFAAVALPGHTPGQLGFWHEQSRTLRVQAGIANPDDSLRAGMSFQVTMKFPGDTYPAVSPLAIQGGTDGAFVWVLGPEDKDLVVMWHRFSYSHEGTSHEIHASLVVVGQDQVHTAMARTVGLPIAMACKLVFNNGINDRGVLLPLKPGIYLPVLDELERIGVVFHER